MGFIQQTYANSYDMLWSRGNPALAMEIPHQTSIYFRYVPYKVVPQFVNAKLVRL